MKQVLTIAGSDSGGGAGIQADLKTMTAFEVYGASVITAITAQNTLGVQGVKMLDKNVVAQQLDSVLTDLNFSAVKTGMLGNKKIIEVAANKIKKYQLNNLVVDPVMVATSGDVLLEEAAIITLIEELIPLATIITPNLEEAKVLAGYELDAAVNFKKLAKELYQLGPNSVLVKGGHKQANQAIDLFYDGTEFKELTAPRVETTDTHGTGCTLSSAIASNLALGYDLFEALKQSKVFITQAIKSGVKVGSGNNPVNHLINI
ncbi:MAG: bifunctional hydroxymethylpyrimidine kinase/phosphomethylpyrimidine kinase [Bacillota bacterium]